MPICQVYGGRNGRYASTCEHSIQRHRLDNGLDVSCTRTTTARSWRSTSGITSDRRTSGPGRTGFAHLFEHLMFEGSEHYDHGYFQPLQEAGASLNGSTNADRTNYWEVVPTNALELALWMESDRMGYLLPALTEAKFNNQRDVVLNERRQNYENRPYGLAGMALVARAVSARPSVPLADDRRRGRSARRAASTTCARSSRPTTTRQRVAGAGRRRRHDEALRARRGVFRRAAWPATEPPPVAVAPPAPPAAERCGWCSRIASSCRGSTRLAFAGALRRQTMRSSIWWPTCWRAARRRGCIARSSTSSASRPRSPRRRTRARSPASSRSSRTAAPGARSTELERRHHRGARRVRPVGPDRGRDRARHGAGGSAVHLSAADRRRVRRQVRSAERLQRVPRRSRITSTAISRAIATPRAESLQRRRAKWLRPRSPGGARASCRADASRWRLPDSRRWRSRDGRRSHRGCRLSGRDPAFTFPEIRRAIARQRPARLDGRAPRGAARQLSSLLVPVGLVRRSAGAAGPRRDHRRPARRRLRRLERSSSTRRSGASARSSTPRSDPTRRCSA